MSDKHKARREMQWHLLDSPNANLTELAEAAAIALNHDEWLDNPEHWIWDLAITEYERINGAIS